MKIKKEVEEGYEKAYNLYCESEYEDPKDPDTIEAFEKALIEYRKKALDYLNSISYIYEEGAMEKMRNIEGVEAQSLFLDDHLISIEEAIEKGGSHYVHFEGCDEELEDMPALDREDWEEEIIKHIEQEIAS